MHLTLFVVTTCDYLYYSHHFIISLTKNIFVLLISNIATHYTDALYIYAFVIEYICYVFVFLHIQGSVMIILIYSSYCNFNTRMNAFICIYCTVTDVFVFFHNGCDITPLFLINVNNSISRLNCGKILIPGSATTIY